MVATPPPPRVSPRGAPAGPPVIDPAVGTAGLTPQMAIVTPDLRPTVFFFRWLLWWRSQAGAAAPVSGIAVNGVLAGSVTNDPISVNGIPNP